jgi:hypothetical protein
MNVMTIELSRDRASFEPGDEAIGSVSWNLSRPAQCMELRLFWFTRGKGTEDVGVAETVRFEKPSSSETRSFRFRVPEAPYSFSGKLISLTWALELIAYPSKEVVRREIVIAPGGREVQLGSVVQGNLKQRGFSFTIG